jgi:hypothetical protein
MLPVHLQWCPGGIEWYSAGRARPALVAGTTCPGRSGRPARRGGKVINPSARLGQGSIGPKFVHSTPGTAALSRPCAARRRTE